MKETPDEDQTALLDWPFGEPQRAEVLRCLPSVTEMQDRFSMLAGPAAPLTPLSQPCPHKRRPRGCAALPSRPSRGLTFTRARIAAGLAIAALLDAALAASIMFGGRSAADDWTTAIVGYIQLCEPETFTGLTPNEAQIATLDEKARARLGVAAVPRDLSTAELAFKTALV